MSVNDFANRFSSRNSSTTIKSKVFGRKVKCKLRLVWQPYYNHHAYKATENYDIFGEF